MIGLDTNVVVRYLTQDDPSSRGEQRKFSTTSLRPQSPASSRW